MMDQDTAKESGEEASAWREVGEQFEELGRTLARAVRASWESEETQRRLHAMQESLRSMAEEVGVAVRDAVPRPDAGELKHQAGRAVDEVRPRLLTALRAVNEEVLALIERLERAETVVADAAPEVTRIPLVEAEATAGVDVVDAAVASEMAGQAIEVAPGAPTAAAGAPTAAAGAGEAGRNAFSERVAQMPESGPGAGAEATAEESAAATTWSGDRTVAAEPATTTIGEQTSGEWEAAPAEPVAQPDAEVEPAEPVAASGTATVGLVQPEGTEGEPAAPQGSPESAAPQPSEADPSIEVRIGEERRRHWWQFGRRRN